MKKLLMVLVMVAVSVGCGQVTPQEKACDSICLLESNNSTVADIDNEAIQYKNTVSNAVAIDSSGSPIFNADGTFMRVDIVNLSQGQTPSDVTVSKKQPTGVSNRLFNNLYLQNVNR